MMATLAETQQLLWALITAPEGVAKALDGPPPYSAHRKRLESTVRSDARLEAVARLDIYANMYFYRLLDVLKDDYPTLVAVVGGVGFHNLVTDYLLRHFPTHPSLRYAGAHLPSFLAHHQLAEQYPFVAELAAFEWALVDSFDAPDAPNLSREQLLTVPSAAWPGLRFTLDPSVRLQAARWEVHQVRQQVDAGDTAAAPLRSSVWVRIWRQGHTVRYRSVGAGEWHALSALAKGESLGAACAAAEEAEPAATAEQIATALAGWVSDGLLSEVDGG